MEAVTVTLTPSLHPDPRWVVGLLLYTVALLLLAKGIAWCRDRHQAWRRWKDQRDQQERDHHLFHAWLAMAEGRPDGTHPHTNKLGSTTSPMPSSLLASALSLQAAVAEGAWDHVTTTLNACQNDHPAAWPALVHWAAHQALEHGVHQPTQTWLEEVPHNQRQRRHTRATLRWWWLWAWCKLLEGERNGAVTTLCDHINSLPKTTPFDATTQPLVQALCDHVQHGQLPTSHTRKLWQQLPPSWHHALPCLQAFTQASQGTPWQPRMERAWLDAVDATHDPALYDAYPSALASEPRGMVRHASAWLAQRPDDPAVMACAARCLLTRDLWGQARPLLEALQTHPRYGAMATTYLATDHLEHGRPNAAQALLAQQLGSL